MKKCFLVNVITYGDSFDSTKTLTCVFNTNPTIQDVYRAVIKLQPPEAHQSEWYLKTIALMDELVLLYNESSTDVRPNQWGRLIKDKGLIQCVTHDFFDI